MPHRLQQLLPWLICALIFWYLFEQIPPQEVWQVWQLANKTEFLFYSFAYFFLVYVLDVWSVKIFIHRFVTPVTYGEIARVRAASYLLTILNYNAGQGALALSLNKAHGAPFFKTLSTIFFITAVDLMLVILSATIGVLFKSDLVYGGYDLKPTVLKLSVLLFCLFFIWCLFWNLIPTVKADDAFTKKILQNKWVHKLIHHDAFLLFKQARLKDYVSLFLMRLPLLLVVIAGFNFAIFAFHAKIPWADLFLYNPLILLAGALPITPAGLGTGPVMTLAFFKTSVTSPLFATHTITPEQLLLGCCLAWYLINQVFKAVFGAFFLKKAWIRAS